MNAKSDNAKGTRRSTTADAQSREARFQKLLDAADSLLAEQHVEQIGLYQIAEQAAVPTASVYHFFPNKEAALLALAERHHEALQCIARAPLLPPPETWQDLVDVRW